MAAIWANGTKIACVAASLSCLPSASKRWLSSSENNQSPNASAATIRQGRASVSANKDGMQTRTVLLRDELSVGFTSFLQELLMWAGSVHCHHASLPCGGGFVPRWRLQVHLTAQCDVGVSKFAIFHPNAWV